MAYCYTNVSNGICLYVFLSIGRHDANRNTYIMKQEFKIEYNNNIQFFFAHSFKSAYEHSMEFIQHNQHNYKLKLYIINDSPFGERWHYVGTFPEIANDLMEVFDDNNKS